MAQTNPDPIGPNEADVDANTAHRNTVVGNPHVLDAADVGADPAGTGAAAAAAAVAAHEAAANAHDAVAIDFDPTGLAIILDTDVQAALATVDGALGNALEDFVFFSVPDLALTTVTQVRVFGHTSVRLIAAPVVDGGATASHLNPLRHRIHFDVVVTTPGTLTLTGDSFDPLTGSVAVNDSEVIAVSASGGFISSKYWDGATTVVISGGGGFDGTVSTNNVSGELDNGNTLLSVRAIGNTTGGVNQFRWRFQKLDQATGVFTVLLDETLANLPSGEPWQNARTLGDHFNAGDFLIVDVFVQRITDGRVSFRFLRDA